MNDADIQLVWSRPHPSESPDVESVVKQADAVVLVLGLSPRLEGEEIRRKIEEICPPDGFRERLLARRAQKS